MNNYPPKISSESLAKMAAPDETQVVVLIYFFANNTHPCTVSGRTNRNYEFRRDPKRNQHVLRVPLSVYMADGAWLANDLLNRKRSNPIVPLIEAWNPAVAKPAPKPTPAPLPIPETIDTPTEEELEEKAAALLAGD